MQRPVPVTDRRLNRNSPPAGDELSARHAQSFSAGTWDWVHIAAAQHARAQAFITGDAAQTRLARRLPGLTLVQLFE
jgi:predicted nucleic acid-binding protein